MDLALHLLDQRPRGRDCPVLLAASKAISAPRRERIDWPGAAFVAGGMGLSVFGFEQAGDWGWSNVGTWLCIVGGLAILAAFVRFELRVEQPLVKIRIFRDRAFVVDNAVLLLSNIAFVPLFFFASIYSQLVLGYDANRAGLYLLVVFAGFAPAAQIGGRMLDRGGARRPLILGSALSAVGFALWAGKVHDYSLGSQWPFIVMAAAGIGLVLGPASTDAVNRSIDASYGEVTGITQTVRNYGSTFGLAILGTVLTNVFTSHLTTSFAGLGLPGSVARSIATQHHTTFSMQGGLNVGAAINAAVQHDFATGIQAVLIGMSIALGVSFVVALRHPGRQAFQGDDTAEREAAPPVAESA